MRRKWNKCGTQTLPGTMIKEEERTGSAIAEM